MIASIFKVVCFLILFQVSLTDVFKFHREITVKGIKFPIMPHPGYYAFTSDKMIISYPSYGVCVIDFQGNLIKKILNNYGPICVSDEGNVYCYDVERKCLISVNIKNNKVKEISVPFQYRNVWQMACFGKYIYFSLYDSNETNSDSILPSVVRYDIKSGNWQIMLKESAKDLDYGLIRIASNGIVFYVNILTGKIIKITQDGKIFDFAVLPKIPEYITRSFFLLERNGKIIVERLYPHRGVNKLDIIDLKTGKIIKSGINIPKTLMIWSDKNDKEYIATDDAVKVELNQNCKIGVFELKEKF
jgi:hypothetical protein